MLERSANTTESIESLNRPSASAATCRRHGCQAKFRRKTRWSLVASHLCVTSAKVVSFPCSASVSFTLSPGVGSPFASAGGSRPPTGLGVCRQDNSPSRVARKPFSFYTGDCTAGRRKLSQSSSDLHSCSTASSTTPPARDQFSFQASSRSLKVPTLSPRRRSL